MWYLPNSAKAPSWPLGFDVVTGPLFQTADEAAQQAIESKADIIGVSSLAAGHLTIVPEMKQSLKAHQRDDIMIIVGGVIPPHASFMPGVAAICRKNGILLIAFDEVILFSAG